MDYLIKMTPEGHPIWVPVPDDPMYEEVSILTILPLTSS